MTGKLSNITREMLEPVWLRRDIPIARIAETLGVTRAAVSWHAKKLGLPSRAGNQESHKRGSDKRLAALWSAGVSSTEIAKAVGYTHHSSVSCRARMMGLPPRNRGNASGFYDPDGQWRNHTPLRDVLQGDLARAMAESARAKR
jgi:hypothetical protein